MMVLISAVTFSSCEDFFTQESDQLEYADGGHLSNPSDTVYSMVGILHKLQAIADRTILLGEVRGDLVDINSNTPSDLRQLALFAVGDSNAYNQPRDYYAVINNCNYYIAYADTAQKNNRNETIFEREYAAAKTFRAWTYLQLALVYGKVPYVTTPITVTSDLEKEYPTVELTELCNLLISDITPYESVNFPLFTGMPVDNRLMYIPVRLLLGDLCLWAGRYREAAQWYYRYISLRNGQQTAYYTTTDCSSWGRDDDEYEWYSNGFSSSVSSESYSTTGELISLIVCPTSEADENYSQLRNIFNSTSTNDYTAYLNPSVALEELSESQVYCNYSTSNTVSYAPTELTEHRTGDLRLASVLTEGSINYNNANQPYQSISKYSSSNVRLYRRTMVYLRLAEALNRAGLPRFAYEILADGINDSIIRSRVLPYYPDDSAFISGFSFSEDRYIVRRYDPSTANTIGIHSRGSGWSEYNDYYAFPTDSTAADPLQYQIEKVEDMIVDESALELAFEGHRYYDLMRVALRRGDPTYLSDRIYGRRGESGRQEMQTLIQKQLTDTKNWYLNWKNQIGY